MCEEFLQEATAKNLATRLPSHGCPQLFYIESSLFLIFHLTMRVWFPSIMLGWFFEAQKEKISISEYDNLHHMLYVMYSFFWFGLHVALQN